MSVVDDDDSSGGRKNGGEDEGVDYRKIHTESTS